MNISNYGIKKMLPRLIIAAVLVNVSYYLCLIAVDLSNVTGQTINTLFETIPIGGGSPGADSNTWDTAVGAILVAGFGVGLLVAIVLAPSILLVFFVILLILVGRQAAVILLTVIAPVAFVAYLLPNTEQWFKKWIKIFSGLLLVFPIIAAVFGASTLASKVIGNAAGDDEQTVAIIALGIQAIPLFAVPALLKGAMAATGGVGAKISGFADARQKSSVANSRLGAYKKAFDRNNDIRRAQVHGGVYRGRNPIARVNNMVSRGTNRAGGRIGTQVAQQGASLARKLEIENVEAANSQINQANINSNALAVIANGGRHDGINGGDSATRAAAMIEQKRRGDMSQLAASWDDVVQNGDQDTRRTVAQAFSGSKEKPAFMGQGALARVAQSPTNAELGDGHNLANLAVEGAAENRYSTRGIASTHETELRFVVDSNGGAIPDAMRVAANEALDEPNIAEHVTTNRGTLEFIAGRGARDW